MRVKFISGCRRKKDVRIKILAGVFLLSPWLAMAQGKAGPASHSSPQKSSASSDRQARVAQDGQSKITSNFLVEWTAGVLSVNADRTSLAKILREVSRQTGVEFSGLDQVQRRVSFHFSQVSLAEALGMLLARTDYATIGDPREPRGMRIIVSRDKEPDGVGEEFVESNPAPDGAEEKSPTKSAKKNGKEAPTLQLTQPIDPSQDLSILLQAMADKDSGVKEAAIQALAGTEGPQSMEVLRQAFPDLDSALKIVVIENIGVRPDAVPLLLEASKDSQASVREAARMWLDSQANQ